LLDLFANGVVAPSVTELRLCALGRFSPLAKISAQLVTLIFLQILRKKMTDERTISTAGILAKKY
jgi:hypothetical protein